MDIENSGKEKSREVHLDLNSKQLVGIASKRLPFHIFTMFNSDRGRLYQSYS
jgi:hypothetical protein